jgi:hypothetical protein
MVSFDKGKFILGDFLHWKCLEKYIYDLNKIFSIGLISGFGMVFWVFEAINRFITISKVF